MEQFLKTIPNWMGVVWLWAWVLRHDGVDKLLKNNSTRGECCMVVGMGAVTQRDGTCLKNNSKQNGFCMAVGWVL
jgi:hypothetical protein